MDVGGGLYVRFLDSLLVSENICNLGMFWKISFGNTGQNKKCAPEVA